MFPNYNFRISRWKKLTALALLAVLLFQPLSVSAAVPDDDTVYNGTSQERMADTGSKAASNTTVSVSLAKTTYAYTGKTIRPKVTVTEDGNAIAAKNYTITYGQTIKNKFRKKTPKAMGFYTIKVTFKKTYKKHGTKMLYFSITPKAPTLTSVKIVKKKTLKVSWRKVAKANGYTIWLVPADYRSPYHFEVKKNASSGNISLKNISAGQYYVYVIAYTKLKGSGNPGRISGSPSNTLAITIEK